MPTSPNIYSSRADSGPLSGGGGDSLLPNCGTRRSPPSLRLDRAYSAKIMYIIGKEQMRIRTGTDLPRKILLATFLWIRDNTRAKIANLRLAMDRVVEVGFAGRSKALGYRPRSTASESNFSRLFCRRRNKCLLRFLDNFISEVGQPAASVALQGMLVE